MSTDKDTQPRRRTRKAKASEIDGSDARSAEIRAVVLDLVAKEGYDRVTIDAIALEARASKATLYRRWPSKAAIVVDAVRERVSILDEPAETGNLRGDLIAILSNVARELGRDADLVIALMAAARRDSELMETLEERFRKPGEAMGRRPLERAIERGELPPDTDMLLIGELAMPVFLHRAIWREPLDEQFVGYVVDEILMRLLEPAAARALDD